MKLTSKISLSKLRRNLRIQVENLFLSLPSRKLESNSNLIAVWTAPRITNNVGDRALTEGALALIPSAQAVLICRDGQEYENKLAKIFLFPQSAEAGKFVDFIKYIKDFKREIGSCKSVLIVGADIMDGKYGDRTSELRWNLAKWLVGRGVKVCLFSMSWNESPTSAALRSARSANSAGVKIFARDELSKSRLISSGITAELAADVSFLQRVVTQPSQEISEAYLRPTKKVLVNVSDWVTNDSIMFEGICSALKSLPSDYEIIYIPMVHYGANTDTVACQKLAQEVPGWILSTLPKPAELRWMAERSEFSISARMHCCLIGFAAGLPSIGLEYQGKFKGAFKLLNLEELAILPAEFEESFARAFKQVMENSFEIRQQILAELPALIGSAEQPIELALQ